MAKLQLEINKNLVEDQQVETLKKYGLLMTPKLNEDYWFFRVKLNEKQSIVGFPKFGTIGIGFAKEDKDWNTNLPWSCDALEIYCHIRNNKGDTKITKQKCLDAIKLIQNTIKETIELKHTLTDSIAIRELLGDKIFGVKFIKKNGELRSMQARLGVAKNLTGGGLKYNPDDRNNLIVYDMNKKGYRTIKVDAIQELTCKGKTYNLK